MKKKQSRLRALRAYAVVVLLSILGFCVLGSAPNALAETPPEIEKVIHAVGGAVLDGSHPANSVVDGNTLIDWVDSPIRPLSMVADNKAAEEKLVSEVVPDAKGECNLAGVSSGSIVAYNAAARVASKCKTVNLELVASPVGDGAVGQLIPPKNPLVEIPTEPLPDNVVVTRKGSNRDGINSCKSLANALECGAGAAVYHYGMFGGGHSVGPKMSYVGADGFNYEISNDASGVSVIAGEAVKLVNPQFQGWSPEQQAQWDATFPAGTPGFGQSGTSPLANGAGPSAVPNLTDMFGNLIQNPVGQSSPQAKTIPGQMGPQVPGQLLPDVIQAGVSVTKAVTSVAGVASAAQSGNPMGLLQAPQALNNVTTAIGDVQQVFTDLSAGTPALGTTPAVAEVAPAAEPAPAPEFIPEPVQAMVEQYVPEPVQAVVNQVAPGTFDNSSEPVYSAPASDPVVQVQSFVNDAVQAFSGGAPAPADAPAPVVPANPVGDLAALGNALFGGR